MCAVGVVDGVALGVVAILRDAGFFAAFDVDAAFHIVMLRAVLGVFQHAPELVKGYLQSVFGVFHVLLLPALIRL